MPPTSSEKSPYIPFIRINDLSVLSWLNAFAFIKQWILLCSLVSLLYNDYSPLRDHELCGPRAVPYLLLLLHSAQWLHTVGAN